MAYIFHPSESAPASVCRILLEQNRRALQLLRDSSDHPAGRIHRSRQCFKRIRAVLRLVRDAAPYVYQVENRFYRDVSRRLSQVRDAEAVVEAIDQLEQASDQPGWRESLGMLKTGFQGRAQIESAAYVPGLASGPMASICADLETANDRLIVLPLRGLSKKSLKHAARKTSKKCARAFAEVRDIEDPEAFHAWRKQVKASFHHARLMQQITPSWSQRYGPPLRELAEYLGQMQNLYVLKNALRAESDELGIDIHLQRLRNTIELSHADLRRRATELGDRLFADMQISVKSSAVIPLRPAS